jgi:HAD superfamily hydrolase (TIGR01484 family)
MRIEALATDYDGTLANQSRVDDATFGALERFRASGRRLILVTGRVLEELQEFCPRLDLFDRVVTENGGVLYRPGDGSETVLADPPPAALIEALRARGVAPIALGRVVVATWQPHDTTASDVVRELGFDYRVVLNKRAVMLLPIGVDKALGLRRALDELGLDSRTAAAVGDAENDASMLSACGLGVAVANALPALKARAEIVTRADHGAGVAELIEDILRDADYVDSRNVLADDRC